MATVDVSNATAAAKSSGLTKRFLKRLKWSSFDYGFASARVLGGDDRVQWSQVRFGMAGMW
jgi:hypothetical protein